MFFLSFEMCSETHAVELVGNLILSILFRLYSKFCLSSRKKEHLIIVSDTEIKE